VQGEAFAEPFAETLQISHADSAALAVAFG